MTLAALAVTGFAPVAASAQSPTPEEAAALGKQAYDYGFPLLEFLRVRREQTSVECPDIRGNSPVNSFSNAGGFATAADVTVVAPNTDTLYSIAHLDLKKGPITLRHPKMGKRYYSFELLDPYTNVIDIPGLREDGGGASSYAIRWTGSDGRTNETVVGSLSGDPYKSWLATPKLPLATTLPLWQSGQSLSVRLVFDPEDFGGAWSIDDVYVDPYRR